MSQFTVIEAEQRSEAWFKARCGRLCASQAKDMLATIKSGEAAARRDLRLKLTCERLTGVPQEDSYINSDMQRGIDLEADAIAAYEAQTGNLVQRVGFIQHNELMAGCSPDGIIDDFRGGVEVKVPRSATHLRYLMNGNLPAEYQPQILHSLCITGCEYWDFVSWDPRFPEPLQLFTVRVPRFEFNVMAYERTLRAFLVEVDSDYEALKAHLLQVAV